MTDLDVDVVSCILQAYSFMILIIYREHLTLTLGVATWMLGSAHHVIMVTISAKVFKKISGNDERKRNVDVLTLDL
jgi:hypothetical protein